MKKVLLFIIISFCIASCGFTSITKEDLDKASDICKIRGGIKKLNVDVGYVVVTCESKFSFRF